MFILKGASKILTLIRPSQTKTTLFNFLHKTKPNINILKIPLCSSGVHNTNYSTAGAKPHAAFGINCCGCAIVIFLCFLYFEISRQNCKTIHNKVSTEFCTFETIFSFQTLENSRSINQESS